jgi:RNA polymerase sigma-70 factor (ECF subfamily)
MDATSLIHPNIFAGASMKETEDVIARARCGDADAFRSIFEHHHLFIMKFLYAMTGDHALAEELTQETFLRAYRGMAAYRGDAKLSTWLCGIAKNVASVSLRSRRYESGRVELEEYMTAGDAADGASAPDDQLLGKELHSAIHRALGKIDEDKRLVFTLKVMQGRSYEEIAVLTGSSVPKLKTDLHRAKLEMRRWIRPFVESSDEV